MGLVNLTRRLFLGQRTKQQHFNVEFVPNPDVYGFDEKGNPIRINQDEERLQGVLQRFSDDIVKGVLLESIKPAYNDNFSMKKTETVKKGYQRKTWSSTTVIKGEGSTLEFSCGYIKTQDLPINPFGSLEITPIDPENIKNIFSGLMNYALVVYSGNPMDPHMGVFEGKKPVKEKGKSLQYYECFKRFFPDMDLPEGFDPHNALIMGIDPTLSRVHNGKTIYSRSSYTPKSSAPKKPTALAGMH